VNTDAVRARFAATAHLVAAHADERADRLAAQVRRFVETRGDERALDAGTGTGALAFALAPLVREVVGVDLVPELLDEARRRAQAFPTVQFVEGDVTKLTFESLSFDLAATASTIHHVARPELLVAELARVTRPGGTILVVDQIAPVDPLAALELNRFEHARDPSHTRVLADVDLRYLFDSNDLLFRRAEFVTEERELGGFMDRAGCTGAARERALALAPGSESYTATIGWYLLAKPASSGRSAAT
jgi:ubiquinone/menaquinone biosynthesis C-methylase UbiE